ncbi:PTS glucose transporter subunit IIA [Clostridium estertheticum]|uniref:PTS sugar transporter subunit IIA n=1 Tax=Clostridium estertheticum TaxID=238834 RepID=UPI001CF4C97F|nr:PTS glucose transporter subunit IIA [Clostridium estertheticum]MCB2360561.1 PTS glucose transporter subunit IIA [Clostridium estertheticum]
MFKNYNRQEEENTIVSPSNGTFIPLSEVPDPVFNQGLLGKGFAIMPSDGIIKAPISGKIVTTSESKHIVGIETKNGYSILIHVGLGTAALLGQGFKYLITENQTVTKGDPLLEFDLNFIKEKAFSPLVLTTLINIVEDQMLLNWQNADKLIAGETPVVNIILRHKLNM